LYTALPTCVLPFLHFPPFPNTEATKIVSFITVKVGTLSPVMGPSKQSLLPIGLFMKEPTLATKKKHDKLQKKSSGPPAKIWKPRVDKKAVQRIAEEQALITGAQGWRDFLEAKGVQDPSSFRCDILFLSNGDAPDPNAPYPEEDVEVKKSAEEIAEELYTV
jgi:hypothetical protein